MKRLLLTTILSIPVWGEDPKAAFDHGDYVHAIKLFQAADRRKLECENSLYIGLSHYQLKQASKALLAFQSAVQCDPKYAAAHLAMGDVQAERGNEGEALAAYERVLSLDLNSASALRAASNLYLKNGLHVKALPVLEKLVQVVPAAPDGHADLAAVYAASGNRSGAEMHFRRALQLQPEYYPALAGLGNLLAHAGDNEAAIALFQKAITARPDAYEAHFLLGSAHNRLNQFEEARAELEKAAEAGGKNEAQVHYQLARAWGGLGKAESRKKALGKFSELTRKEKENTELQRRAESLIDEARVLLKSGDLESAADRLERAREARPGDATLLFRLASLNFDLKRYDGAREYVLTAISISPTTWLYHFLLGLIEKGTQRLQEATTSLEVAARLNPSEAPIFNALGQVAMARGDRNMAISYFERACALAPADADFRSNLQAAGQP